MTEAEWLSCGEARPMLDYLRAAEKATDRRLRLWSVACCRHSPFFQLKAPDSTLLAEAERDADEVVTREQYGQSLIAYIADSGLHREEPGHPNYWQRQGTVLAVSYAADPCDFFDNACGILFAREVAWPSRTLRALAQNGALECSLFRDIFANPFRPTPAVEQAWLTPDVVTLAGHIYHDQALDQLPELADALEEAGCTDPALLGHLRGGGTHVRGCWAVDAVLGRK